MATATLNPLFISVSGRIDSVVFYRRKNTQCVRTYVVPRNPNTASQRKSRSSFANAVRSWQKLTAEQKYRYARRACRMNMSGYNLYISEYMKGGIYAITRPKATTSFPVLANRCSLQRRIHSVSDSLSLLLCTLAATRELYRCREHIRAFIPADS